MIYIQKLERPVLFLCMKKIKKILIFGAEGMFGQEFINYTKNNKLFKTIALNRDLVDITDFNKVLNIIKQHKPDVILNCAALINIDYCENNPTEAWMVNAIGAGHIVQALNKLNINKTIVLYISTSDVFGNPYKTGFKENDIPLPINVYGWSKLGGEKILSSEAKINNIKYFIIRTSWLYSQYKDTFVDFVVQSLRDRKPIPIISDQYNVITWARDLAKACEILIMESDTYNSGIYHLTNKSKTQLSKYTIALRIADKLKLDKKYCKQDSKNNILKTPRPDCAILKNNKFILLPNWQESLDKYLSLKYGKK